MSRFCGQLAPKTLNWISGPGPQVGSRAINGPLGVGVNVAVGIRVGVLVGAGVKVLVGVGVGVPSRTIVKSPVPFGLETW